MTDMSSCSLSVFVSVAVKKFTRSDGINKLWSNKYCIFWVCVCSLSYPACKAHAPYYIVICGLSGCTKIFPHYLINGCAVNTLRLSYTNQSVNVVQWNNRCLFWDPHKTHKYSPYLAVNTLRHYKMQSVNVLATTCHFLIGIIQNTWIYSVGRT
jgi:hypothetical protein